MNRVVLKITYQTLRLWLNKEHEQHISAQEKLSVIMGSLMELCTALATDGTEESTKDWYAYVKDDDIESY